MRLSVRTRAAGAMITATIAFAASLAAARGGAETRLDRYRSLLQEKRALQRENRFLQREADLARSPSPYIFFDVRSGTLSFRVRGKELKDYRIKTVSSRGWGRRPVTAETLWRLHDGPLTILEKEGGRREIVPPSGDDEQGITDRASDAGAGATDDATILGVKAPEDYFIKFEEGVIFHVQSERRRTLREKAVDRLGEIAGGFRTRVSEIWRRDDEEEPLTLFLVTDPETARRLYHSILPGERVYLSPPPPPSFELVASGAL